MFVVVIFTTTSVGFSIFASGTESTLTSFVPWYTRAFMILLRFFYDGGTLCARRYSGGRASRTSPGETSRGAGHGGRRCPHAARFSARIGPNATSEAELFRSPCQRISLLVHERFRPVHGSRRRSGGRGDATPQLPAR